MRSQIDRFVPGQPYFIVVFDDENLTVPIVQTLVYVEKRRRDDGSDYFLFRELTSGGEDRQIIVDGKHANHLLLNQEELLNKLKHCFDGKLATTPSWEL